MASFNPILCLVIFPPVKMLVLGTALLLAVKPVLEVLAALVRLECPVVTVLALDNDLMGAFRAVPWYPVEVGRSGRFREAAGVGAAEFVFLLCAGASAFCVCCFVALKL